MAKVDLTDELKQKLGIILDAIDLEDVVTRERQIRKYRYFKLLWEGFSQTWWDDVARDWRVYDQNAALNDNQGGYYDKPINVLRAYLESIIAALSITVPPVTCYPDDATNPLDLETAKAGDKISALVYRHNNVSLLWLHALYVFCTEGPVFAYSYPKEDFAYGTYEEKQFKDENEQKFVCPHCQVQLDDAIMAGAPPELVDDMTNQNEAFTQELQDQYQPDDVDAELQNLIQNENMIVCPQCAAELDPSMEKSNFVVRKLVGITKKPKTRQCIEVYGGLYVKIPNWAMAQKDCPYLRFSYETHYVCAIDKYPNLRKSGKLGPNGMGRGPDDPYEQYARLNPQYRGEYPDSTVTVNNYWIRPEMYNVLRTEEDVKDFKTKWPNGVKVVRVNDTVVDAVNESLDDCWTVTYNPMADYLVHDPLAESLVSVQDITNTLISLVLQTIEHGIPQTFVSPAVLNLDAYSQTEATPGALTATKANFNKPISEGFQTIQTATLSQEVLPFANKIQELGQLVTGALPSLFGGQLDGSKTASEYSMSRAQALQRLQNTWKIFTVWWKEIFGKVIPAYIECLHEDERFVTKGEQGDFLNVYVKKAELQGKIGNVELEANENLPITYAQIKDIVMKMFELNNPEILEALASPENMPILKKVLGLDAFVIPGESDRQKQYEEIKELTASKPLVVPPDPMMIDQMVQSGQIPPPEMMEEQEKPSVPIDPDVDNHEIEAFICRTYLVSDAGRYEKVNNPKGYRNVLLHMKEHQKIIQQQQMQQAMMQAQMGGPQGPGKDKEKPSNNPKEQINA